MALSPDVTANLIMAAIKEDRLENRSIKDRVYANTSLIMTASFVMTPFLFEKTDSQEKWIWFLMIDGALLVLMWALFVRMMRDANLGQRFMEMRERQLHALQKAGDADQTVYLVFAPLNAGVAQGIRHPGPYWVVACATLAILVKLAAILWMLGRLPSIVPYLWR